MSFSSLRKFAITLLIPIAAFVSSCDGEDICLNNNPAIHPVSPLISILVTSDEPSITPEQLCNGSMLVTDPGGLVELGEVRSGPACWYQSSEEAPARVNGSYSVKVSVPGFKVYEKSINPNSYECDIVSVEVQLAASDINCVDGYFDSKGTCKTRAGCVYPLVEEQISEEQSNGSGYEFVCVEECTNGNSEKPAVCEPVVL